MVRVNNLANDAAVDQVKIAPDSAPFASAIDLFKNDNSCSRSSMLPLGFDNNFSITGLDTGKGPGLKFTDNMPVLRTDSKGFDDRMPVLRPDTSGIDDRMPVLQFNSDDIYNIAPDGIRPDCFIDTSIPEPGHRDNSTWAPLDADQLFGDLPMWKGGSGGSSDGNNRAPHHSGIGDGGYPGANGGGSSSSDRSIANRTPDEDRPVTTDRPRGSVGYGDAPKDEAIDSLPKLPLEGKSILELDPKINPRLGCALAVSGALHELDPSFPITNNNKQLALLLKKHGYEAVPQDGSVQSDNLSPGDVLIGQRPAGMPGHAAIFKGQGKIYENNSDTGTIIGDGNLDRFNDKMHDKAGRWNKNGFSDVTVYRKVPVVGMSNY